MADVTSSPHDGSPWAQRGFILAAAFIAGLVLLGLALLVLGTGSDDSTNGSNNHSTGQPSASTPARKDPNASVCGLPAGSQQIPAVAPRSAVGARRHDRSADRAEDHRPRHPGRQATTLLRALADRRPLRRGQLRCDRQPIT